MTQEDQPPQDLMDGVAKPLARAIRDELAGRVLVVGGFVRDRLLGIPPSQDIDLEVYGVGMDDLVAYLATIGIVQTVGRAFGVVKFVPSRHLFPMASAELVIDIALPRTDNKNGTGHRGFVVCSDPHLSFRDAFSRRDLTINSMGLDPLTGEIIDPFEGQKDLAAHRLRATSPQHFSEDPLRALRVAQFAARLQCVPDQELQILCRKISLDELPAERITAEFNKLMLQGVQPSRGLSFLQQTGLIKYFPEIAALQGVPQNTTWHPEGDVWTHTLLVIDQAAELRPHAEPYADVLMYAALCHDLGKPACTQTIDGTVHARGHEKYDAPVRSFLGKLTLSAQMVEHILTLVHHHLQPYRLPDQHAGAAAYRRLARAITPLPLSLLGLLARADLRGRGASVRHREVVIDDFLRAAKEANVKDHPVQEKVLGRHLIAKGMQPGPYMHAILRACRDYQDETGEEDPHKILEYVCETQKF